MARGLGDFLPIQQSQEVAQSCKSDPTFDVE
jgi:hypothetical protein